MARRRPRRSDHAVILNWRDPWHPEGGGSELYVQQIAARLVDMGMRVTVFSASYAGAAPREVRDGITYVRRGGHLTVYLWAAVFLLTRRFGRVDEVMEVQNGMPFLARLFTVAPGRRPRPPRPPRAVAGRRSAPRARRLVHGVPGRHPGELSRPVRRGQRGHPQRAGRPRRGRLAHRHRLQRPATGARVHPPRADRPPQPRRPQPAGPPQADRARAAPGRRAARRDARARG